MDFARVIDAVSTFLSDRGHPFAVIGGVAVAAYGMVRTTFDVDAVTSRDAQAGLVEHLELLGYETVHRSAGYSNHEHDDPVMGRVDIVYVSGETRDALFADVQWVAGPGSSRIPVLRPGHLVAMKIFAIKNDPSRTLSELDDIRFLLTLVEVDSDEVRSQFEKHGLERLYAEID